MTALLCRTPATHQPARKDFTVNLHTHADIDAWAQLGMHAVVDACAVSAHV